MMIAYDRDMNRPMTDAELTDALDNPMIAGRWLEWREVATAANAA